MCSLLGALALHAQLGLELDLGLVAKLLESVSLVPASSLHAASKQQVFRLYVAMCDGGHEEVFLRCASEELLLQVCAKQPT